MCRIQAVAIAIAATRASHHSGLFAPTRPNGRRPPSAVTAIASKACVCTTAGRLNPVPNPNRYLHLVDESNCTMTAATVSLSLVPLLLQRAPAAPADAWAGLKPGSLLDPRAGWSWHMSDPTHNSPGRSHLACWPLPCHSVSLPYEQCVLSQDPHNERCAAEEAVLRKAVPQASICCLMHN